MTSLDKERSRRRLQELLEEIDEFLDRSEEAAEAVAPDKGLGRLSRMEAMQDQQLVLEVRRRQKRRKAEVLGAISRLEQNQYGQCLLCGSFIGDERLEVFPEVGTCMNCA